MATDKERKNQRTTKRTTRCSRSPFPSGTGTSKKLGPGGYESKQVLETLFPLSLPIVILHDSCLRSLL